jgi:hypothetical protein
MSDITGLNKSILASPETTRLRGIWARIQKSKGASPNPFDRHWITLGETHFTWWTIIGSNGEQGVDGLIIERTGGPFTIVCLN